MTRQQPVLTRVKLLALSIFAIVALGINQHATNMAAHIFGLHGLYAPWQWLIWWAHWPAATAFQPVWDNCRQIVLMPTLALAGTVIMTIVIARNLLGTTSADLYGSARWASQRDMVKAGLLAGWI
jgi:type IV secretory pathway TraG/TraD family ATPase VirD4